MTKTGSISFKMTCDDEAVGGGKLTLYKVGEVAEDDGNYSFELSDAYAGCDVTLDDITSASLAQALADYTTANGLESAATVEIGNDGTATASELALGLYLVMQHTPASGYEAIAPFLVSVPMFDEGEGVYVYDINAEPKMSGLTKASTTTTTTTTTDTTDSGSGTTAATTAATLPQTGQLNWPVPVLTVAGLLLILAGLYLRSDKRAVHGA